MSLSFAALRSAVAALPWNNTQKLIGGPAIQALFALVADLGDDLAAAIAAVGSGTGTGSGSGSGSGGGLTALIPAKIADLDYVAQVADGGARYTALTATRTTTLPDAALYPITSVFYVADETGSCSPSIGIIVQPRAGQKLAGNAGDTLQLQRPYAGQGFRVTSDGSGWII